MFSRFLLIFLSGALVAGCLGRPAAPPEKTPVEPQPPSTPVRAPDRWLTEAQNDFAFDLFEAVRRRDPGKNQFISPVSVALALSMTFTGAGGTTAEAMSKVLHLEGRSPADVNQQAALLQTFLNGADEHARAEFANSIWYRKGFDVNQAFLKAARTHYAAEVAALDFRSAAAARTINQWISKATYGRIEQMLTATRPADLMYLVNTVYFKAPWHRPFDPEKTRPRSFHLPGGRAVTVPMLSQSGWYAYTWTDSFQAVMLDASYRYRVVVVLPHEDVSADRLYADLAAAWPLQYEHREGSITMPKLKLSYGTSLKEPLEALGMGVAFSGQADFSGLAQFRQDPLFISDVVHKTFLELNEEGIEAAAATMEAMAGSAPPKGGPFEMVVDRPYFLGIVAPTGGLLFMGSIQDPR